MRAGNHEQFQDEPMLTTRGPQGEREVIEPPRRLVSLAQIQRDLKRALGDACVNVPNGGTLLRRTDP